MAAPLFSYFDKNNNYRGPFTAKSMQQWYENGFFKGVLQVFIHRGHVANRSTLEELCAQKGDVTPFLFLVPPHRTESGFLERPPGFTVEVGLISS
ncbi:GYF domain protein [Cooperia oncophora]